MLFEDSPAPRVPPPEFTDPWGPLYEYDNGNGTFYNTGVSGCGEGKSYGNYSLPVVIQEPLKLDETPIYSGLIFRIPTQLAASLLASA